MHLRDQVRQWEITGKFAVQVAAVHTKAENKTEKEIEIKCIKPSH
jgi:hypothetical protein